jgi:hypothetical protein
MKLNSFEAARIEMQFPRQPRHRGEPKFFSDLAVKVQQ